MKAAAPLALTLFIATAAVAPPRTADASPRAAVRSAVRTAVRWVRNLPARVRMRRAIGDVYMRTMQRHLDPATFRKLATGLRNQPDRKVSSTLRTAIGALLKAQGKVKTAPMKAAVDAQIRALGELSASVLSGGVTVRTEAVRGSERGAVRAITIESKRDPSVGIVITQGSDLSVGVQLSRGARHRNMRVSTWGVTRTLDDRGTRELSETITSSGKILWTRTQYTLGNRGSSKPTHVKRTREFVDLKGNTVPVKREVTITESGSKPQTTVETLGRVLVEDRKVGARTPTTPPTRPKLDGRWARPHVLRYLEKRGLQNITGLTVHSTGQTPTGKSTRVEIRIGDRIFKAAVNHGTGRVQPRDAKGIRAAIAKVESGK